MKKRMMIMLIALGVLFGGIFLWKAFGRFMMMRYMASQIPVATVSAMKATTAVWQPTLKASGSLRAMQGINVTPEIAGMVQAIRFEPGAMVKQNDVLLQLNADAELGQLQALEAQAELAKITYNRDKAQFAVHAVSKQTLDTDEQNLKSLQGQVAQQAAIVAKKTIRAPFAGRVGISKINLGQYLNPGDKIVSLQTLDPIYVDFFLPQQVLPQLAAGQIVTLTLDARPGKKFTGKITTVDPAVDKDNRNIEVEATVTNTDNLLTPGMFATVEVNVGKPTRYLTLPQTAVSFNPYGEIAYVIRKTDEKDKDGKPVLIAKQVFVTTGETRGDQVTILKGLKEGDMVVTSGQLKLKNGSRVKINNSIVPLNSPDPKVSNEHLG